MRSIEDATSTLAALSAGRITNPEVDLIVSVSRAIAATKSAARVSGLLFLRAAICGRPYSPPITIKTSPSRGVLDRSFVRI